MITLTLFNIICIFRLIRKNLFLYYKELKNTLNNIKILNYGKVAILARVEAKPGKKKMTYWNS